MTSKKNEHAGLFALLSLAMALPFAAWYGFVVSKLWGWFVAPLGVVYVGVWEAAGIYLLARLLTLDSSVSRDEDKAPGEKFAHALATGLIAPAFALGFAAIYHGLAG